MAVSEVTWIVRGSFGLGGDINLRQQKINLFAGANFNQRKSISKGTTDRTTFGNPNSILHQDDKSTTIGNFKFFRAGLDYFLITGTRFPFREIMSGVHSNQRQVVNLLTDLLSAPPVESFAERTRIRPIVFAIAEQR